MLREILLAPVSARTYRELLYLLVAAVLATAMFAVIVTGLAAGALLAVTFLGLPLLALVVYGTGRSGAMWRGLSRTLLRDAVAAPTRRPRKPGVLGFIGSGLTDRTGWRAVAFTAVTFPLSWVAAYGVIVFVGLSLAALTSPVIWLIGHPDNVDSHGHVHHSVLQFGDFFVDSWPRVIALSVIGLLLCFCAPWLIRGLVALDRWLVRAMLGRTAGDARVHELEEKRAQVVEDSAGRLRRVERDLHDGTQARLVSMAMSLGRAREKLETDPETARDLIDSAHATAKDALTELRDLVRSISPPVLDQGLDTALETLTSRSPVPVALETHLARRASAGVETIAYFSVAELLTNVARHSGATLCRVSAWTTPEELRLAVWDNGHGGAKMGAGSGLAGLRDRASSVDGELSVSSPAGGPTLVTIWLPAPKPSP